jgi:hypothetical protein
LAFFNYENKRMGIKVRMTARKVYPQCGLFIVGRKERKRKWRHAYKIYNPEKSAMLPSCRNVPAQGRRLAQDKLRNATLELLADKWR